MGRKRLGAKPLTVAEKCRRYRAKKKRLAANPNARGHEWGTPIAIIEAVREVFGGPIECDPATHAAAQERVQARTYYTAENDGLDPKRRWRGRIFLNPPYERGLVDRFVNKLLFEYVTRHTTEAIVLVNAQTDARWYGDLTDAASACCQYAGRVRFLNSDGGKPGRPQVGQAIFYIGPNASRFRAVFRKFGRVIGLDQENMIDSEYVTGRPRAVSLVTLPAPVVTVADVVVTDTSDGVSVTKIRK